MSTEAAQTALNTIAAIAFLAWLGSVWFALRARRESRSPADRMPLQAEIVEGDPTHRAVETGTIELEGRPDELATRAVECIAAGQLGSTVGPTRIHERSTDHFEFEVTQPGPGRRAFRGSIHFKPAGPGRTAVDHTTETDSRWAYFATFAIQTLALVVLVALYVMLSRWVVPSPNPSVRAQAIQMCQIVHLLWPPFLFIGIQRGRQRHARSVVESFLQNLPHRPAV